MTDSLFDLDLPFAYQRPPETAWFKARNADFCVTEVLGCEPKGEGEHALFWIHSDGDNTQWIADQLAKLSGNKSVDIGFCGLKDRNSVTQQWFSIYDPKRMLSSSVVGELGSRLQIATQEASKTGGSRILKAPRDSQKLRRGSHSGNRFDITLRFDLPANSVESRLQQIVDGGVPNYFGLQRFGREGNNLVQFEQWLGRFDRGQRQRKPKGIVLSAARSYLFNCVLSARVLDKTWNLPLEGELVATELSSGSKNSMVPSGPLWGRGRSLVSKETHAIETQALEKWTQWQNALEHLGLKQERRPLCCLPQDFSWHFSSDKKKLMLSFFLPPGQYATSVLREIADLREPVRTPKLV